MTKSKLEGFMGKATMKQNKPVISREDLKVAAHAIYQAAKANGDDLESPFECAKAAFLALGYEVD